MAHTAPVEVSLREVVIRQQLPGLTHWLPRTETVDPAPAAQRPQEQARQEGSIAVRGSAKSSGKRSGKVQKERVEASAWNTLSELRDFSG